MAMAAAEPISARILRNRAKLSSTKLPSKLTSLPAGSRYRITPAATKSAIARPSMTRTMRAPPKAPSINSTMAPSPSTISGHSGVRAEICATAFIASPRHCRFDRRERVLIIVHQLRYGSGREVEHRFWIDAEHDGQDDERRQHHHLTPAEVADIE